jgi:drug/metabolite transporter (DMT)-like permease
MDAVLNKAKAIVGLLLSIATALVVSFPDSQPLQITIAVLGAAVTAVGVYAVPNKEIAGQGPSRGITLSTGYSTAVDSR